jgi:DNA-binding LacI/PurR family transcriptional regulator
VHERLIRAGVVLANCQTTQKGVACCVPDDEHGQYEGVCKLLAQGYRRPLCVHLPEKGTATPLRRKGMQRAFKDFNVQFRDEADYLQTVPFLNEALDKRPRPDCVICGNDRVALVAYQHLLSRGFRIPNDIGILGFDDMVGIAGLFCPRYPLSACLKRRSGRPCSVGWVSQSLIERRRPLLALQHPY